MMAAPRKKLPERSVDVLCAKCRTQLFKYKKGGSGSLVKCYVERIVEDFTNGDLHCPSCGGEFARESMIHGRPAYKMIGGKVLTPTPGIRIPKPKPRNQRPRARNPKVEIRTPKV